MSGMGFSLQPALSLITTKYEPATLQATELYQIASIAGFSSLGTMPCERSRDRAAGAAGWATPSLHWRVSTGESSRMGREERLSSLQQKRVGSL